MPARKRGSVSNGAEKEVMTRSRRRFLGEAAAIGALGLVPGRLVAAPRPRSQARSLLILGGTGFLGPHIVEAALERGHRMTLFNRGRTNDALFPNLEKLRGDRDPNVGNGLAALKGRRFDAVIDTSGYVPRHVGSSASLLARSVEHYVFVSSVAAYKQWGTIVDADESTAIDTSAKQGMEDVNPGTYGPLKAGCERSVAHALPGKNSIIRPGLIAGPGDHTDRFTYWPVRIARGGQVLAPGGASDPVQFIDARDLADWIITLVEQRTMGKFNAVGPRGRMTIAEMLYGTKGVMESDATFTWVPAEFLAERGVRGWRGMPVWVDPDGDLRGVARYSNAKAVAAGLTFRPLAETARETLDWFRTLPADRQASLRAGISREREREILDAWDKQFKR